MSTLALETRDLCKQFGKLRVSNAINLKLAEGARHALIGPNGAGKSTLINLLTGVLKPSAGQIFLQGRCIDALSIDRRATLGLGRTYQVNALFPHLTPLEATTLAICRRMGLLGRPWRALTSCEAAIDEANLLLQRMRLDGVRDIRTVELPYGRQRLLEIALALAGKPKVLLLDEPAAGVPGEESFELMEVIAALPEDVAVLFIEHDMDLVFRFAQRISVLVAGAILIEGTALEIADNPEVRRVYLGAGAHV
jgi:ABC-type branched-subunit amino acid transport system ATPase component